MEEGDRHGELIVKDNGGIEHRFEITATHTSPIPEDTYAMIHTCIFESSHGQTVVGWLGEACQEESLRKCRC